MTADEKLDLFMSGLSQLTEEYGWKLVGVPMVSETEPVYGSYFLDDGVLEWLPGVLVQKKRFNPETGKFERIKWDEKDKP